jgi:hypothetical protein
VKKTWSRDGKTLPAAGTPEESTTSIAPAPAVAAAATDAAFRTAPAGAEPAAAWTDDREGAARREAGAQMRAPMAPMVAKVTARLDFIDDLLNVASGE